MGQCKPSDIGMAPLEAAEKLEWLAEHLFCSENLNDDESANACGYAAFLIRSATDVKQLERVEALRKENAAKDKQIAMLKKELEVAGKTLEIQFPPTKAENWMDMWKQQAEQEAEE